MIQLSIQSKPCKPLRVCPSDPHPPMLIILQYILPSIGKMLRQQLSIQQSVDTWVTGKHKLCCPQANVALAWASPSGQHLLNPCLCIQVKIAIHVSTITCGNTWDNTKPIISMLARDCGQTRSQHVCWLFTWISSYCLFESGSTSNYIFLNGFYHKVNSCYPDHLLRCQIMCTCILLT